MKTNPDPDPEHEDGLLDAILRDDAWHSANSALKVRALGTFRARQRVRRATRWTASMAAGTAAAMLGWHSLTSPAPVPEETVEKPRAADMELTRVAAPSESLFLTDEELLASFPPGSCILAEIDGRLEVVFLDPDVKRQYLKR